MNTFLNSGFILLPTAVVIRLAISYFSNTEFMKLEQMADVEKWFYAATIMMFALSFWHQFIRRRCPSCNSTEYIKLGAEEIDRWMGIKKVTESLGNGKSRQRHINVTRIKTRSFFKCDQCENEWDEISVHERT